MIDRGKQRNNDTNFFLNLIPAYVNANLNVAQIGKIVTISQDKKTVDIQPLPLTENGNARPLLKNVYVGRTLQQIIKVGDVGIVLFLDRSIQNWDGSNRQFSLNSTRMHSVNDAFLIEVY